MCVSVCRVERVSFHVTSRRPIQVTLLNFIVTPAGLSEQLLGLSVRTLRPDLEDEKSKLIVSRASNLAQLRDLETKILQLIAAKVLSWLSFTCCMFSSSTPLLVRVCCAQAHGEILDDSQAVEALTASKNLADEIAVRQVHIRLLTC